MERIKRGVYVGKDRYPTTEITNAACQLRSGSVVLEDVSTDTGFVGVVCEVYTGSEVSLCLKDYATKGNMQERDFITHISKIRLIKF